MRSFMVFFKHCTCTLRELSACWPLTLLFYFLLPVSFEVATYGNLLTTTFHVNAHKVDVSWCVMIHKTLRHRRQTHHHYLDSCNPSYQNLEVYLYQSILNYLKRCLNSWENRLLCWKIENFWIFSKISFFPRKLEF